MTILGGSEFNQKWWSKNFGLRKAEESGQKIFDKKYCFWEASKDVNLHPKSFKFNKKRKCKFNTSVILHEAVAQEVQLIFPSSFFKNEKTTPATKTYPVRNGKCFKLKMSYALPFFLIFRSLDVFFSGLEKYTYWLTKSFWKVSFDSTLVSFCDIWIIVQNSGTRCNSNFFECFLFVPNYIFCASFVFYFLQKKMSTNLGPSCLR